MFKITRSLELKSPAQQHKRAPNHRRGECTHLHLPNLKGFPSPSRAEQGTSCKAACPVQAHLHCSLTSAWCQHLATDSCVSTTRSIGLGRDQAPPLCSHVYPKIHTWTYKGQHRKSDGTVLPKSLISHEEKPGTAYSTLSSTHRKKPSLRESSSHSENASWCVTHTALKFKILLSQHPKCCDYSCVLSCSAQEFFFKKLLSWPRMWLSGGALAWHGDARLYSWCTQCAVPGLCP